MLGLFIAGMQRRKLDRDARIVADIGIGAGIGNRGDRAAIAQVIAGGVAIGARGLAKHVIGIGIALFLHVGGAVHGRADVLAQNELAAHFLHGAGNGGADHRLAQAFDRAAQVADGAGGVFLENLAGQHQGPGRGIDQR